MMKYLVIAAFISVLLIGTGFYTNHYVTDSSGSLLKQANSMEQSVRDGNWQEAKNQFDRLNASWVKINYVWTIILDHQELDSINQSMVRTEQFLDTRYKPGFMAEAAQLKMFFQHIPKKDALNLQNIL